MNSLSKRQNHRDKTITIVLTDRLLSSEDDYVNEQEVKHGLFIW